MEFGLTKVQHTEMFTESHDAYVREEVEMKGVELVMIRKMKLPLL